MVRTRAITIVGAGPAGLTAAITLAWGGYRVVVHEQHPDVGGRFHGDLQGLENWSAEEDVLDSLRAMRVEPDFYCRPITVARAYTPQRSVQFGSRTPLFYLVRRGEDADSLDESLKRQAQARGVEVRFNSRLAPEQADIIATGPREAHIVAAGMLFETTLADTAMVMLDNALAPHGYAYLLTADGRATLATTMFARFQDAKRCLERSVTRVRALLGLEIRNPRRFTGYGTLWRPRSAIRSDRLYVGEAAGFQDNLFGFGIRFAMTSGYLAARSLLEGLDYDALWRAQFGSRLRTSLVNRLAYELLGRRGHDYIVRKTAESADPRELWKTYYTMSRCRPVLYPLAALLSHLRPL